MKAMLSKFLLRDFSSLQSRYAIVFGWALESPVLVQMNQLPEHHRPKSDDPDFWAVWSGEDEDGEIVERNVNWKAIADDWQQINTPLQDQDLENHND